jgi:hypothetical protein
MSIKSLRSHEGYLMLDHTNNQGIPDELVVASGLPLGAGKGLFEAPTFTCHHCQTIVIINPNRTRERAYCRGCDHLLCDACGAERARTGKCRPFNQVIDEYLTSIGE